MAASSRGKSGNVHRSAVPGPAGRLVRRERLNALLDTALLGSWAVVCAPAGCGKSSLLADWSADRSAQLSLTSVTGGDLASRLREETDRCLRTPGPRVLVVDSRESLSRAAWRGLAQLTEDAPGLTVVVATRTDPPLPLGRLAPAGDLVDPGP